MPLHVARRKFVPSIHAQQAKREVFTAISPLLDSHVMLSTFGERSTAYFYHTKNTKTAARATHWDVPTSFRTRPLIGHGRIGSLNPGRQAYSTRASGRMAQLAKRIPDGTWDTHMHIIEPAFPIDKAATYRPAAHTLKQARSFLGNAGIRKMVIVQPSIFGNDNACTLSGLRTLGLEFGRAVIQFDPASTSKQDLQHWHSLGVRGVRVNFKSVGETPDATDLETTLRSYADVIRHLDWVVEIYISCESLPPLVPIISKLDGVKFCLEHIGHPSAASLAVAKNAQEIPGFSALLKLLKLNNTWVKLSGTYRLHNDPKSSIVESMCREILTQRPDRCVFATDWPHTRFENIEVAAYIENLLDWVEAEGVSLEQVFVKNAEELFDATGNS